MKNLNPRKIETLEQIDTQFVRIDYVHERNVCSKFGKNRFTGDFWAKGWNITFCVTFLICFSRTNVEKRPLDGFWRAMAQKTRNRARMCLFGVIKWKIEIWPQFTPKTLKIWPWIGNFQPKWWNMKLQVSHTRTVVRECCKGDDASQWENGKFDPSPRPNSLTDRHKNLHTWLGSGYLPTGKI